MAGVRECMVCMRVLTCCVHVHGCVHLAVRACIYGCVLMHACVGRGLAIAFGRVRVSELNPPTAASAVLV